MEDSVGLIAVLIIGLIGFFIWLAFHLEKKRREAFMASALELGFEYQREGPGVISQLGHFKLFQHGRAKRARNVLRGKLRGCEVLLTDYRYTTGSGKNSHTHTQTICAVKIPGLGLPHCFLRKQNRFLDYLGKVFGGQDINFEEDPGFSDAFVLQGMNEQAVRDLFDPSVRQYFLRFHNSRIQFEAQGDTLLLHHGKPWEPGRLRELVDQAMEIRDLGPFNKR